MVQTKHYARLVAAAVVALMLWLAIAVPDSDLIYGAVSWFVAFMDGMPSLPELFLFLVLIAIPATLLHELGHALAARTLLGVPVSIDVGSYGKLAHFHLGQVSVALHAIDSPARAAGWARFDASRATARDVLLIALAGPAASAVGLVVAIVALGATPVGSVAHGLAWVAVTAGVSGVLNLIPFKFSESGDGTRHPTDGRLALDAARVLYELR